MNPGGIRAGEGNVTDGEAFKILPFESNPVTMTLTGAQIEVLLEQQIYRLPERSAVQPFQVSEGRWCAWNPEGLPTRSIPAPFIRSVRLTKATVESIFIFVLHHIFMLSI